MNNKTSFEIYRNGGWLLVIECDEHFVTVCLKFYQFDTMIFGYSCFLDDHDKPRIKVRQVV